jgi:hypothetical protein
MYVNVSHAEPQQQRLQTLELLLRRKLKILLPSTVPYSSSRECDVRTLRFPLRGPYPLASFPWIYADTGL